MIWHIVTAVSIAFAVYSIIRHRKALRKNLKRVPARYRFLIGVLLVVCAFIPGPLDEMIVVGLIVKLAKD